MKLLSAIIWLVGFEIFSLICSWYVVHQPYVDPMDGSTKPTTGQMILYTHVTTYLVLAVCVVFYVIFVKVWKSSNRRR